MAKVPYIDLLRDPAWQRKRLEILQRDDFRCQTCGDGTRTLHVHHKIYLKGRRPWDYDDSFLVTLCEKCHEAAGDELEKLKGSIGRLSHFHVTFVRGFVDAIAAAGTGTPITARSASDPGYAEGVAVFLMGNDDIRLRLSEAIERLASKGGSLSADDLVAVSTEVLEKP